MAARRKSSGTKLATHFQPQRRKGAGKASGKRPAGGVQTAIPPAPKEEPNGSKAERTLDSRIARAKGAGRYLVFTVRTENGRVYCDWNTQNFPIGDLPVAKKLLDAEFPKIETTAW